MRNSMKSNYLKYYKMNEFETTNISLVNAEYFLNNVSGFIN